MRHCKSILLIIISLVIFSCEKDKPELSTGVPTMGEVKVTDNGSLVFEVQGSLKSKENLVKECGFYVGNSSSMENAEKFQCKLTGKTFATTLVLEGYSRKYYVSSYISNGNSELLSAPKVISIGSLEDYVTFGNISLESYDRESETTILSTKCSVKDGVGTDSYGILYGTSSDLVKSGTSVEMEFPTRNETAAVQLTGLRTGIQYYICQYLKDNGTTVYSQVFTIHVDLPKVTTENASSITPTSVSLNARIDDDGGLNILEAGFYWSDVPFSETSGATKIVATVSGGLFKAQLSNLAVDATYYYQAYAINSLGISYGEQLSISTKGTNLSAIGSANCYIVSEAGGYKFRTVKGNSSTSVGSVASCEVLWESFGTAKTPSVGDLVRNASYSNGYISFETATTFCEGNAVIAAKDASSNILWSWHIWLTDQPKGQTYNNGAGVMMDRNLGATSATKGNVGALGLLYQWGRKDPFLGSSSISSSTEAESTITWPSSVSSTSSTGTIAYATAHPTTFITHNSNNYDWYYSYDSTTDNTRWESSKTIYDPCPAGWRVPEGGSSGVWVKAFGTSSDWRTSTNWDSSNNGMDFSKTDKKLGSSGPIWYPASGCRNSHYSGHLSLVGIYGYYWSVSPSSYSTYYLYFNDYGYVNPADGDYRAFGLSVRCLQE